MKLKVKVLEKWFLYSRKRGKTPEISIELSKTKNNSNLYQMTYIHKLLFLFRYQSMLPVLKMASIHNVELVKFFFKLLYQADTQKSDVKGKHI